MAVSRTFPLKSLTNRIVRSPCSSKIWRPYVPTFLCSRKSTSFVGRDRLRLSLICVKKLATQSSQPASPNLEPSQPHGGLLNYVNPLISCPAAGNLSLAARPPGSYHPI